MSNSAGPTALGKIYQYFGDTMGTLINGYFYKCVKDRDVLPTYSWENVQVQEGTSGSQILSELDDVTITDPTNNQILKYDAVNEVWVNSTDDEGQTIQLEELPERWDESEIEENAIYQYIGETYRGTTYSGEHIDYKNGYFYKATKVTNIPFILWEELYGTKDWSELDRSVKRNYIPSIEFEATLPDSGFDVEIQKDGTFIVNSKTGTIRDNILFWEGTTIPAGEYILCTELLSGALPSGCIIFISVKNETTSESELAEISSDISHPFKAGGSLIINEGDTIKFRIYATGNFTRENTFKFHALFQQFSIVDRSWQPADMLDNIELSNKIPDTSKMINIFTGTQAEWDAFTTEEKLTYKQVNITDDSLDINDYFVDTTKFKNIYNDSQGTTTTEAVEKEDTFTISENGLYQFRISITNIEAGVASNHIRFSINNIDMLYVSQTGSGWISNTDCCAYPLKAGTVVKCIYHFSNAGFRYSCSCSRVG